MNPPNRSDTSGPYILVVDDDKEFREALREILKEEGYSVLTACDGEDAFCLTKKHDNIRLVISDLRMPILNGIALLELIRDQNPLIRVIIVTAYEEVASYLKVMSMGAFEYMKKPLNLDKLKELVVGAMSDAE